MTINWLTTASPSSSDWPTASSSASLQTASPPLTACRLTCVRSHTPPRGGTTSLVAVGPRRPRAAIKLRVKCTRHHDFPNCPQMICLSTQWTSDCRSSLLSERRRIDQSEGLNKRWLLASGFSDVINWTKQNNCLCTMSNVHPYLISTGRCPMHLFVCSTASAYCVRVASDSDVVYYTCWSLLTLCVSPPEGLRLVAMGHKGGIRLQRRH